MEEIKNEELIEEIKEESPVYVLEESIPDILALNDLQKEIDKKENERVTKDAEVKDVESKRIELAEKIGIINNGQHINEVALNLKNLRDLDEELKVKKNELEDIYGDLRSLEEDRNALEESSRRMVEEFTKDYNKKKDNYEALVNSYISTKNPSDYEEANIVVSELNNYKEFSSFDDIRSISESKEEEKLEETTEEKVEEKPLEETPVEETNEEVKEEIKETEPELSEVKVDNIDIPEEITSLSTDSVKEEPIVDTTEEVKMPSFEDLLAMPEVEEKPVVTVLLGKSDKIADSNKKGVKSTIEVFNPKKIELDDKKLTLTA